MLYINGTRAQQKWRNGHVPWGLLDRRHMMLILLRQVARTWQEHRCWWTSHRFTFDATCFGFAIPAQGDLIPIFSYNFAVEESSELEKFDFPIADLFSFLQRIFSVCSAFRSEALPSLWANCMPVCFLGNGLRLKLLFGILYRTTYIFSIPKGSFWVKNTSIKICVLDYHTHNKYSLYFHNLRCKSGHHL